MSLVFAYLSCGAGIGGIFLNFFLLWRWTKAIRETEGLAQFWSRSYLFLVQEKIHFYWLALAIGLCFGCGALALYT